MLARLNGFVATFPSTNWRIFTSIWLSVVYVLGALVMSGVNRPPPEHVLYIVGGFLLIMAGLDVAQFKIKRDSYVQAPPARPDVEDAPAVRAAAVAAADAAPAAPRPAVGPLTPMGESQ